MGSSFFGFSTHPTLCSPLLVPYAPEGATHRAATPRADPLLSPEDIHSPGFPGLGEHSVLLTWLSAPALGTRTCRDMGELPPSVRQ